MARLDEDHPRVGGEKRVAFCVFFIFVGSPPRGRGKGLRFVKGELQIRITPAWAGKS